MAVSLTMSKRYVAPSILSADYGNLSGAIKNLADWDADLIHCDVMDGIYVPNITFGMPMIAALKRTAKLPLDVHLMIDRPERYAKQFIDNGADILTFHPDASADPMALLDSVQSSGCKCGIAFNPNIAVADYAELVKKCDMVTVMGVYAGFGGQKFIESALQVIRTVKDIINSTGRDISIEVDGGATIANVATIFGAGANIMVAGSAVFGAAEPQKAIKDIRNA